MWHILNEILVLNYLKLFIIIAHISTTFGEQPSSSLGIPSFIFYDLNLPSTSPSILAIICFRGLGLIANYVFLISSCWFLTQKNDIKINKIIKMLLDVWFISIIFLIVYLSLRVKISNSDILQSVFPTIMSTNWFITIYLVLYLIHPLLNIILKHLNKAIGTLFIGISLPLFFIFYLVFQNSSLSNAIVLFVLVYIYVGLIRKFWFSVFTNKKYIFQFFLLACLDIWD